MLLVVATMVTDPSGSVTPLSDALPLASSVPVPSVVVPTVNVTVPLVIGWPPPLTWAVSVPCQPAVDASASGRQPAGVVAPAGHSTCPAVGELNVTTGAAMFAQETPWMVVAVGFPAASFRVTVMSNGAPPGHVTGTHVSVFIAVTAAMPTQVVEPPSATHRLLTAAPSDAGNPAASVDVVLPQTLNRPWLSRSVTRRTARPEAA